MQIVRTVEEVRAMSRAWRKAGQSVGFVPTMGALHAGHASLVAASKRACGRTVASIFVNPAQFGPGEDYERYPRTWDEDLRLLEGIGTDCVWNPDAREMYPPAFSTWVDIEGGPAEVLEGEHRPGHFRGVLTVVLKLLLAVEPDIAYFGAKDWQQTVVVRRMAEDLRLPVRIVVEPTVREADGLAMSSRNRNLDPESRRKALGLSAALAWAASEVDAGRRDIGALEAGMTRIVLERAPEARIDYAVVREPVNLTRPCDLESGAIALLAVRLGAVRLIDNRMLVEPQGR